MLRLTSGLRRRLDGGDFQRHGICLRRRQRHPVRHLRHDGAEPDHERGKNHYVTHHAELDQRSRNITTPAAKPRPTAAAKVAILAKRMTEVLTAPVAGRYRGTEAEIPGVPRSMYRCKSSIEDTTTEQPAAISDDLGWPPVSVPHAVVPARRAA